MRAAQPAPSLTGLTRFALSNDNSVKPYPLPHQIGMTDLAGRGSIIVLVTVVRKLIRKDRNVVHTLPLPLCYNRSPPPLRGHAAGGTHIEEAHGMISYRKLWLLLDRRGYAPRDIISLAGISYSTYQKLVKNDSVRLDVLERVCTTLRVDIGDVCSFRGY